MWKFIITLIIFFIAKICFAQNYILPNEKLLFSFKTKNQKKMVLVKDENNKYIIYRFGTSKKIELEYPEKNKDSWSKFTFFHYMRGGGIQNSGMELESLFFKIENYDYVIYKDYYAEGEVLETGILITNLDTKKEINSKGKFNSIKGKLYYLFESGLIKEDENRIR